MDPQRSDSTDIAVAHRQAKVLRLLIEQEGGMQDESGWTALMFAAYWNNLECARLLAERERDMKTTRRWFGYPPGTAALGVAKREGRTAIVSILSG